MSNWVNEKELEENLGSKLLIAGLSESGKTAVKRLYFQKSSLEELKELSATLNYERLTTTINNVPIAILDLGGQRIFIKQFLSGYSPFVFSAVHGLIFLYDVSNKTTQNDSIQYFTDCVKKLNKFSPEAQIFIFLHKIDLLRHQKNFDEVLQSDMEYFQITCKKRIRFFYTSIYEPATVINAFLRIIELIIPGSLDQKIVGEIEHFKNFNYIPNDLRDLRVEDDSSEVSQNQYLEKLEHSLKTGLADTIQILHNRNLLKIHNIFNKNTLLKTKFNTSSDNSNSENLSLNILKALRSELQNINTKDYSHKQESRLSKNKTYEFENNIQELSEFYGIQPEDAEKIIEYKRVALFNELVMKLNIPVQTALQVLLINIPFLKSLGNDITFLNDKIILDTFKFYLTGDITEREIFQVFEIVLTNPETNIKSIIDSIKRNRIKKY